MLYGSNFSIGMNFFFKAVQAMAPILKHEYRGSIVERHHVHKKDKPSGTAVTIQKILESGSGEKVEDRFSPRRRDRGHAPGDARLSQ